jgi:CBS domain-containing protein
VVPSAVRSPLEAAGAGPGLRLMRGLVRGRCLWTPGTFIGGVGRCWGFLCAAGSVESQPKTRAQVASGESTNQGPAMNVRDIMNQAPATIRPNATLAEALQLMADRKVRHLVVVEAQEADVVGILSDRDLAMFYDPVNMTQERWQQGSVSQLMSKTPVTIGSGAKVEEAARMLLREGVSALPVVDNGQLVGILSDRDFVRHFAGKA